MSYAYTPVELGPIAQMHALRRLFGTDNEYSNEALAAISRLASARRVPAGETLVRAGEPFGAAFLIVEGLLELSYQGMPLGPYGSGEAVGMLAGLARDAGGWSCRTLRPSTLLVLRVSELFEVFEDHFELLQGALIKLSTDAIGWRRKLLPSAGYSSKLRTPCIACGRAELGLVERTLHLRHTIGLEESHVDQLTELARAATELRVPAGTRLWAASEPASQALAVVSGVVRCQTLEGAHFRIGPGQLLGNLETIAGLPRWYDAQAERDLVALSLDGETIVDVWEDHPTLGFAFLRKLGQLIVSLRLKAAGAPLGDAAPLAVHA